jgi:hypothetical protein
VLPLVHREALLHGSPRRLTLGECGCISDVRRLLPILVPAAFLMSGCPVGAQQEDPTLKVVAPLRTPPDPEDTSLRLLASVDACPDADAEVVDVTVEETETEVLIDAGLRVGNGWFCEIRTAQADFAVDLDRPLGQRLVIDNSGGDRSVIWSPERRRSVLRRLQVTRSDAEAFVRSKFPGGENIDCGRRVPAEFSCTLTAPSRERRVVIYVLVRAGGELKALPEIPRERLPPELRTRSSP